MSVQLLVRLRRRGGRGVDDCACRPGTAALARACLCSGARTRGRDGDYPRDGRRALPVGCHLRRHIYFFDRLDHLRSHLSLAPDPVFGRGRRTGARARGDAGLQFDCRAVRWKSKDKIEIVNEDALCEAGLWPYSPPQFSAAAVFPMSDGKTKKTVKKVVLAYSGGLDTSIILKWLQTTYGCEVVTFTADLGQGEELAPAREKALLLGIKPQNIFIEDLREEFVRDYVFPMFRANTLYEGTYLLGTSIARPLIAKKQIEIAHKVGADAVCHGATGKGNDQVRFELTYYALDPSIKIVAPWREWAFKGRDDLLAFAREHQIPIAKDKEGEAPFSVDANLLHSSSEGKVLEDPSKEAPPVVYQRTVSPMEAPDQATEVRIGFDKGDPVSLNGKKLSPAAILTELNALGKTNGIGRIDLVENRFVGMKSRGVYETPGGTILLAAHRAMESITLDRGAAHLKDDLMPRYAELIYNGFWFTPEREMLQALIDKSQEHVEGEVRLKLYKGNVLMAGRESRKSLYSSTLVTFEDDKGAYDQKDAEGFIRLNALRLRTLGMRRKKTKR